MALLIHQWIEIRMMCINAFTNGPFAKYYVIVVSDIFNVIPTNKILSIESYGSNSHIGFVPYHEYR